MIINTLAQVCYTENLRAISNELNLQFKVLKTKQEILGEIQDEKDSFLSSYKSEFREEECKTGEANEESNQAQEKEKETQSSIRRLYINYRLISRSTAVCHKLHRLAVKGRLWLELG